MYVVGELVLKLVVSLLLLSVHGSHRWEDFTMCIICGNTRMFNRYHCNLLHSGLSCPARDLATRKEVREKAWQRDGWAETVSKVRYTIILRS